MLASDGYYEFALWNGHKLEVWTTGRLAILKHPKGCSEENGDCRERIMKYIHNEGLLDEVLDKQIVLIDSYIDGEF